MSDRMFGLWFAFCVLLSVAWLGFIVWAIYSLVSWVTAK
jgi:hypothetical protein